MGGGGGGGGGGGFGGLGPGGGSGELLESSRVTFTLNEFEPPDQVFPSIDMYCLLHILIKISSFTPVLSIRIVLYSFYLLIVYSEKFPA